MPGNLVKMYFAFCSPKEHLPLKVIQVQDILEYEGEISSRQLYVLLHANKLPVSVFVVARELAFKPITPLCKSKHGRLGRSSTLYFALQHPKRPLLLHATCICLSETGEVMPISLRSAGRPTKFDSEPGARRGSVVFCCEAAANTGSLCALRLCIAEGLLCSGCHNSESLEPMRTCFAL